MASRTLYKTELEYDTRLWLCNRVPLPFSIGRLWDSSKRKIALLFVCLVGLVAFTSNRHQTRSRWQEMKVTWRPKRLQHASHSHVPYHGCQKGRLTLAVIESQSTITNKNLFLQKHVVSPVIIHKRAIDCCYWSRHSGPVARNLSTPASQ